MKHYLKPTVIIIKNSYYDVILASDTLSPWNEEWGNGLSGND